MPSDHNHNAAAEPSSTDETSAFDAIDLDSIAWDPIPDAESSILDLAMPSGPEGGMEVVAATLDPDSELWRDDEKAEQEG